jgi:arylsulfatase
MRYVIRLLFPLAAALALVAGPVAAQQKKPNILVIMGDDIGMWNVGAYSHGMMGFHTPNIDRIAKEGAIFSDRGGRGNWNTCKSGRTAPRTLLGTDPRGAGHDEETYPAHA